MKAKLIYTLLVITLLALNLSHAQVTENICLSLKHNLKYRSNDKNTKGEVRKLQNFLLANGYMLGTVNGNYGPATLKAVKDFQEANGLIVTGIVGKITREKIGKLSCGLSTNTISVKISEGKKSEINDSRVENIFTKERLDSFKKDYIDLCLVNKGNPNPFGDDFRTKFENLFNKDLVLSPGFDKFSNSGAFIGPEVLKIVERVDLLTCTSSEELVYENLNTFHEDKFSRVIIRGQDVHNFLSKKENYDKLYVFAKVNGIIVYGEVINANNFLKIYSFPGSEKWVQKADKEIYLADIFYLTAIFAGDSFDKYNTPGLKEGDKISVGFSFSKKETNVTYFDLTIKPKDYYLQEIAEAKKVLYN